MSSLNDEERNLLLQGVYVGRDGAGLPRCSGRPCV